LVTIPAIVLAVAALGSLYGWALAVSTISHPGSIGLDLDAPGGDWTVFYGAVRALFSGNLELIFDGDRFTAYLNSTFSWWLPRPMPFRPWVYPPSYLLVLRPFLVDCRSWLPTSPFSLSAPRCSQALSVLPPIGQPRKH
jgi:hypothetical protein